MDFGAIFRLILQDFPKAQINFALIGGFALASHGYPRATIDIDFLVDKKDFPKIKELMLSYGYTLAHESEDAANFVGGTDKLGRVDFLLAHRKYTAEMLKRAVNKDILNNQFKVKVLKVEDLIGLKVQASSNDPERYHQDMSDIETLLKGNLSNLDLNLIKEYFSIFEREKELAEILKRIKNAQ